MLGTMIGVREAGYPGRLLVTLDNKAVVDNFNNRAPIVDDPMGTMMNETATAPCLDDLADSDLWAAIDTERRLWQGRIKVQWNRSHPETRKAKSAWTRHEHANAWSDWQADDIRDADADGTRGLRDRIRLAPTSGKGAWGILWQGERIITSVNRAIRAALKADSFAEYLKRNRGWDVETVGSFSRERWATRLSTLRNLANATVVTKLLTGWLASQSVLDKRHRPVAIEGSEQVGVVTGTCRLCGNGQETNWHVQAECTHPKVVAERRAVSGRIQESIATLSLPEGVTQLLSTNWLLDEDGRAHDLTDLDMLETVLEEWAPDIALRASDVQKKLKWASTQGPWRDNLRKWAFRGVMLNHWSVTMVELGCTPADAQAALAELEVTIIKTVPDIWNVFSAEVHEEGGADSARAALEQDIEDFFLDWAKDQGPIPVTRGYVQTLTQRAKRRWLTKRRRELRKRRKDTVAKTTDQLLITRYIQHVGPTPEMVERVRSAQYLRNANGRLRTKRKRWRQSILRDSGFEPSGGLHMQSPPSRPRKDPAAPAPTEGLQPINGLCHGHHEGDDGGTEGTTGRLAAAHAALPPPPSSPSRRLYRTPRWGGQSGSRAQGGPPPGANQHGGTRTDPRSGTTSNPEIAFCAPNYNAPAFPVPNTQQPTPQEETQYAIFDRG